MIILYKSQDKRQGLQWKTKKIKIHPSRSAKQRRIKDDRKNKQSLKFLIHVHKSFLTRQFSVEIPQDFHSDYVHLGATIAFDPGKNKPYQFSQNNDYYYKFISTSDTKEEALKNVSRIFKLGEDEVARGCTFVQRLIPFVRHGNERIPVDDDCFATKRS